jgi:hypothetical protein
MSLKKYNLTVGKINDLFFIRREMRNLILFVVLLISACTPSDAIVQTAIAKTQLANPAATATITSTPKPTLTSTATSTPTEIPTDTPTLTPTPDLRIVDTDPQKLLCTPKDMPEEGMYYLPNSEWTSINTNEEIISIRTVEKGRAYVIDTGRVTGWWIARKRGTRAARLPDELECGVYMFKTAEGALIAMNKYNQVEYHEPNFGWRYLKTELEIDQPYIVEIFQEVDSGGDKNTTLLLELTYRNLNINVHGYAKIEEDVPLEVLEELAIKMLNRIKEEPLVDPADAVLAK